MTEVPVLELFDTNDIIYLTPDATDMLEELDKDKVYVIGGIVDESVIKVGLRWINSGLRWVLILFEYLISRLNRLASNRENIK